MTIDTSTLFEEYIDDATGHLDEAESVLLQLEERIGGGEADKGAVTRLLGTLHTLKGNSGMMGFVPLQQFFHSLESLLKQVADGSLPFASPLLDGFFEAISSLRAGLRNLADNPSWSPDISEFRHLVHQNTGDGAWDRNLKVSEKKGEFGYVTAKSSTLKVNFEKLDDLLNLVGELVIHRTALRSLEARLCEKIADKALLEAFSEAGQHIGKTAGELREAIMKVRMLPVRVVFQRFTRLVRDLSMRHDKQVRLHFEGEDTELDKTVIDEIGEPLLHLIRNAVDHGIEGSVERQEAGKSLIGTIFLRSRHENNHIIITVEDDGRGISLQKLRNAAIAKGVLGRDEAGGISDQEALELVFLPGFSTSSMVTETSGRGIGLDVVKKNVASLGGTIEISSRQGMGTVFTIKLPLTLAIISALMVEVTGEAFAIPLTGVLESLKVSSGDIHLIGDREMINLRDRLLPIYRLDHFFRRGGVVRSEVEYVVVVGSGERRGGLVVDRLLGQQEIVIKAMDDYFGELPGIAGGTVLGDGRISLVVDIPSVIGVRKIEKTHVEFIDAAAV